MIKVLLSTRLGELRMKQSELARATGIRPTTINELYHEKAERVNLNHLDKICNVLHCSLSDIIIHVPDTGASTEETGGQRSEGRRQ